MASIIDVAKKAGVSIATVSRYYRGTAKVLPETAARIGVAAKELNYTPDFFASSLKRSHSNQICLSIGDVSNLFFNAMSQSLALAIQPYHYHFNLMLTYGNADTLKMHIKNSLAMRVSAFMYVPESSLLPLYKSIPSDTYSLQLFLDLDENIDSVIVDDAYGTELAVSYFLDKGYSDVIMLDFANENLFKNRTRGFNSAYAKHGLTPTEENIRIVDYNTMDETIEAILNKENRPAILAVANKIGTAVIKHVYERKLQFKKDLGLIIYDDMELAQIMNITCMGHDIQNLSSVIVETLREGIESQGDPARPIRKKVCKPFLLERDSV